MSLFRSQAFLRNRNPSAFISNAYALQNRYLFTSVLRRTRTVHPDADSISSDESSKSETPTKRKGLVGFFKEALGLSPGTEESVGDDGSGTSDLSRKLKQLETKLRSSNKEQDSLEVDAVSTRKKDAEVKKGKHVKPAAPSLSAVFMGRTKQRVQPERLPEAPVVIKKLSPEVNMFLDHLFREGYFNVASFMTNGKLEPGWYNHSCGRDFIKFAAEKFGKDHQEIAKFLLSSDLKKVALFGCPSVARKTVDSAKRLRIFFSIPEQTVCGKCSLKSSCKFVNQHLGGKTTERFKNELSLLHVLRVITLYALELVSPNLTVPDDLKASANQLLTHIVELSRTTKKLEVKE